jgi:uncharacterized flavoprotein (TIGR03862 family)
MKKSVNIIGGGPAALMLACMLDQNKFDVTIYEKNNAPARKFLVAGDGGFNLTHSEEIENLISRYTPESFLEKSVRAFTNNDLREWLKKLGIETFVGSSKRVFPIKGIKPIDVLNAFLTGLKRKNVAIKTLHEWKGWNKSAELVFDVKGEEKKISSDITVFSLGGASWSKTGSGGAWAKYFEEKKIKITPFQASNCAYEIKWGKSFLSQWEGKSLKNISLSCSSSEKKGELVITKFGIEGGAVYALGPQIRNQLAENGSGQIFVDLKPTLSIADIKNKLSQKSKNNLTQQIKEELKLDGLQIALLKSVSTKEEFTDIKTLSEKIKKLPLTILSSAVIDEAISTVGGISLDEVDENFQLKKLPNNYVIGEMLDWDAPTGGYLLQACFSMGAYLGQYLTVKAQKR